jgi:hypothetical protein
MNTTSVQLDNPANGVHTRGPVRLGLGFVIVVLVAGGWMRSARAQLLAARFSAAAAPYKERMAWLYKNRPPLLPEEFHPPPVLQDRPGYWNGYKDALALKRIRTQPIVKVTVNHGGSSVSLRLHLKDGASAAFKPDQVYYQSMPRKEIVAYLVNRALGLARVPPATHRLIPRRVLFSKMRTLNWRKRRLRRDIKVRRNGMVAGEVSWWIPQIRHLPLGKWKARKRWYEWLKAYKRFPKHHYCMAAQLSVMLIFDFLIDNLDRFSGRNVCASMDGKHLYFMDNTLSFFPRNPRGSKTVRTGLWRVQRFSKKMYGRLKALKPARFQRMLEADEDAPWKLLAEREVRMFLRRRAFALKYIHRMIALYGWEKTMVFP